MRPALLAAACAALVVMSGCSMAGPGGPTRPTLHIGVDLPLTGPEGRGATPALNGIRFFVQQHPTLDGFAVSIVSRDDAGGGPPNPQLGAANITAFLKDPSLIGVIGPFDSAVARKEIPVANAAGLAMVSPSAGSTCLTKDTILPAGLDAARVAVPCQDAGLPPASELRPTHVNNFFRLAPTDDLQGPAAADFAAKNLHLLRVAVMSDNEAYGQALAAGFTARFQKLGGSVVGQLAFDPAAAVDATPFLRRVKADGAQAVYYGGATAGRGCTVRAQMKGIFDAGVATPFLGSDGIAEDPACVSAATGNALGIFATVAGVDAGSAAGAARTIAAFRAAFGRISDYGPYTIAAYDATAVLYSAIDRAIRAAGGQLPVRGNVVSQLSATQAFPGAIGPIGFDPAGDNTTRVISVFQTAGEDARTPWKLAGAIDYSAALPY
ncbi:MAG TPA: branched-chain amino acid ABC transporter substrate-binding protein [Candidatus Dormibacteraeota bacterium]